MPPTFAEPSFATTSPKKASDKMEEMNGGGGKSLSAEDKELGKASKHFSVEPIVTADEASPGSYTGCESPRDTPQPVSKTELLMDSNISLQEYSTSTESVSESALSKLPSEAMGNDVEERDDCLQEEQNNVVNVTKDELLPLSLTKKHDDLLPDTVCCNDSILEEEQRKVVLDDIDSLALRCADKKRKEREGLESLLLLSRVAEDLRSSGDEDNKTKQPSGQSKQLKKRKFQLPMRADRKDGPLPKRMAPPPQRTPAFFHFLLHHRQAITRKIFPDEGKCHGLEMTQKIAEEGAVWWLKLGEKEKQKWVDVSTREHQSLLRRYTLKKT